MNRRKKKPQRVDYAEVLKTQLARFRHSNPLGALKLKKQGPSQPDSSTPEANPSSPRGAKWRALPEQGKALWHRLPKWHQRGLMVLVPLLVILLILPTSQSTPETASVQVASPQRVSIDINTTALSQQSSTPVSQQEPTTTPRQVTNPWQEDTVKSGDTLAEMFRRNGLSMADLNALVKVEGQDKPLSQIRQGQLVRYKVTDEGQLDILQLEKNQQSVMFFRLSDGGFGRSK